MLVAAMMSVGEGNMTGHLEGGKLEVEISVFI